MESGSFESLGGGEMVRRESRLVVDEDGVWSWLSASVMRFDEDSNE